MDNKHIGYMKFKNLHFDETCLIIATGPSVSVLPSNIPKKIIQIGVNQASKYGRLDYAVITDRVSDWHKDNNREEHDYLVSNNKAKHLFTKHLPYGWDKTYSIITVGTAKNDIVSQIKGGIVPIYLTTTIAALSIAMYMGFKKIGVIGFDLKTHPVLEKQASNINWVMSRYNETSKLYGFEILNLSNCSLIKGLEHWDIKSFLEAYGDE